MAEVTGDWKWGLRITPILSFGSLALVILFLKDPPRGESEGANLAANTSWKKDVLYLLKKY